MPLSLTQESAGEKLCAKSAQLVVHVSCAHMQTVHEDVSPAISMVFINRNKDM